MGDIYGKASLCICAATGKNSKAGFLPPRPSLQHAFRMPFYPSNKGTQGFYTVSAENKDEELYQTFPIVTTEWDIHRNSIWNTQAWTLQERVLSPRVLLFTYGRIFFECAKGFYTEFNPVMELSENETRGLRQEAGLPIIRRLANQAARDDDPRSDALLRLYYAFIEQYSSRSLSYVSDMDAAFSACTAVFQKVLGFEKSVFGTILEDLPRSLMWISLREPDASREDSIWPSWSWYSHTTASGVTFHQYPYHMVNHNASKLDQVLA